MGTEKKFKKFYASSEKELILYGGGVYLKRKSPLRQWYMIISYTSRIKFIANKYTDGKK